MIGKLKMLSTVLLMGTVLAVTSCSDDLTENITDSTKTKKNLSNQRGKENKDKVLFNFRNDPESYIKEVDFIVEARKSFKNTPLIDKRTEYGGPCTLTAEDSENKDVFRVHVKNGGNDYYFPWVNRGVGEVKVPKDAPNGTIVTTGGMNGCALVVTEVGNHFIFYHDADSNSLSVIKEAQGQEVFRLEPKDYDPLDTGVKLMEQNPGSGIYFTHQFMIVKHKDKWKVFTSSILLGPGINLPVIRPFAATASKYFGSF